MHLRITSRLRRAVAASKPRSAFTARSAARSSFTSPRLLSAGACAGAPEGAPGPPGRGADMAGDPAARRQRR